MAAAGLCLRSPLTCVGAMAGTLKQVFGLSGTAAGLMTTLPLLAFAAVSSLVVPLSKKFGTGRLMVLGLAVLAAGTLLRPFTGKSGFFIFTVMIGAGIAVGNVLIPSVIKKYYPDRLATMNGLYTTSTLFSAGLATAFTTPLLNSSLGWQGTLSIWAAMSVAAIIVWTPLFNLDRPGKRGAAGTLAQAAPGTSNHTTPEKEKRLLRSKVAWFVTLYFGFQSMLFFGVVAWLFSILTARGMGNASAGYICTISFCSGIPLSIIYTRLISKKSDHRFLGPAAALCDIVFILLLAFAPWKPAIIIGAIGIGLASGGLFNSSVFFFTARAKDSRQAIGLSSMAQTIGYVLTASSSLLMGLLFDLTGNWTLPLMLLALLAALSLVFGYLAGVKRYL